MIPMPAVPAWNFSNVLRTGIFVLLVSVAMNTWAGTLASLPPEAGKRSFDFPSRSGALLENTIKLADSRFATEAAPLIWGQPGRSDIALPGSTLEFLSRLAENSRPFDSMQTTVSNSSPATRNGEVDLAILNLASRSRSRANMGYEGGVDPGCHKNVPEPASILLLGASLAALAVKRLVSI